MVGDDPRDPASIFFDLLDRYFVNPDTRGNKSGFLRNRVLGSVQANGDLPSQYLAILTVLSVAQDQPPALLICEGRLHALEDFGAGDPGLSYIQLPGSDPGVSSPQA